MTSRCPPTASTWRQPPVPAYCTDFRPTTGIPWTSRSRMSSYTPLPAEDRGTSVDTQYDAAYLAVDSAHPETIADAVRSTLALQGQDGWQLAGLSPVGSGGLL